MEELELVCFQIISAVGEARSDYIEAIQLARESRYEEAEAKIASGRERFNEGHHAHGQLLMKEASNEELKVGILLLHSEDQLMSAEAFGILAEEFIALNKKIDGGLD